MKLNMKWVTLAISNSIRSKFLKQSVRHYKKLFLFLKNLNFRLTIKKFENIYLNEEIIIYLKKKKNLNKKKKFEKI